MGDLTLTIRGKDFTVDWGFDRDPTPTELEQISRSIFDAEFAKPKATPQSIPSTPPMSDAEKRRMDIKYGGALNDDERRYDELQKRRQQIESQIKENRFHREQIFGLRKELAEIYSEQKKIKQSAPIKTERKVQQSKAQTRQTQLAKLPFAESEIRKAVDLGLTTVTTKSGGFISMKHAITLWEKATGEKGVTGTNPNALDNPELYAFDLAGKTNPAVAMSQFGKPYVPSRIENPERDEPMLTNVPSKVLKAVVRNDMDKYPHLSKQEKQDILNQELGTGLVKGADEVFNLSKYFVPGLQTLAGAEDAAMLGARVKDVGFSQAGQEAIHGFIQGANVFESGISTTQRITRGINAVLLGIGLTHGAIKGYQGGKKLLAQTEIANKFGLTKEAAGQWLQKMEGTVVEQIRTADERGVAFNDGKLIESLRAKNATQNTTGKTNSFPNADIDLDSGGTSGSVAARMGGKLESAPDVMASPGQTPSGQRILPAPIVTGKAPKSPRDILRDAQKRLHMTVFKGKPDAPRALGTYNAGTTRTVIKYADDLDTAAHEISHALDDVYGIIKGYATPRAKSPFDNELQQFWVHTSRPNYKLSQKRFEGVAEWIRAYIVNPDEARRLAPNFYDHFVKKVDSKTIKALDDFGKDIREYAGATNVEKVKANIVFDRSVLKDGIGKSIQEFIFPGAHTTGYTTPGVSKFFKRYWTDDIDPVVKGVRETMKRRGLTRLLPEHDPILLARGLAYFKNKYDSILEHGMVNGRNERIGKPVQHILEPLDSSSKESLTQDLNDMLALIVSERSLEKSAQLGKERVTNFGAGFYRNSDVAIGAIDELAKNPERFAKLQESASRYREWADQILQYAVDKGRLSKNDYNIIKANNQYYAAMNRLMDDGAGRGLNITTGSFGRSIDNALGKSPQLIKGFKGSTRPIENPLVNLLEQGHNIIKDADRNEVLLKWRNMLTQQRRMHHGQPIDLASIGHRVPNSQKGDAITIWVDGKKERWVFEKGIHDSLKDLGSTIEIGDIPMKVLSFFPKVMREAVTHTPGFAIRNRIRDIQDRLVKSRTGSNIGGDTFKPITQKELENYSLYGGGVGSGRVLDDKFNFYSVQKHLMNQMAKDKFSVLMLPGKGIQGYKRLIEAGERAGRIGEVRSALRQARAKGYDEYNAQLFAHGQSRDLLDFARGGKFARVINRFIPFTNAQIQGVARTMTVAHENPGRFVANWIKYAVTPTMVNYAWNRFQGDEVFQEYLQLPSYLRRTFYNFKVGDMWVRIPKPYEIGATASLLEHTIDTTLRGTWGKDRQVEEHIETLKFFSPFNADQLTGGAVAPLVESITNYDSFKNKAIVPYWEANLNLVEREGTKNASRLGQALQGVFKVDARMIDHHIESLTSDFGRAAMSASDIGRTDRVAQSPSKWINYGTGLTTDSPSMNAVDVQWVLREAQGLGVQRRSLAISNEIDAYNDAKSPEAKRAAARKLWLKASQIRKKAEQRMKGVSKESKDYKERLEPMLKGG